MLTVLLYKMEMSTAFSWCVLFMVAAGGCQILLLNILDKKAKDATYALVSQQTEPVEFISSPSFDADEKRTKQRHGSGGSDMDKEGKGPALV